MLVVDRNSNCTTKPSPLTTVWLFNHQQLLLYNPKQLLQAHAASSCYGACYKSDAVSICNHLVMGLAGS